MLPAASEIAVAPAAAFTVPLPHVVDAFGTAATVTPSGSVSETPRPCSAAAPGAVLAIEIVSVETPPTTIGVGLKALLSVTFGAGITVSVALAGAELLAPCVVESAPAGIVFAYVPALPLVTFTVMMHVAAGPRLPADRARLLPPAAAVTVPLPHVVDALGAAAIATPGGSESVSDMPVSAIAPGPVFATVTVSCETSCG